MGRIGIVRSDFDHWGQVVVVVVVIIIIVIVVLTIIIIIVVIVRFATIVVFLESRKAIKQFQRMNLAGKQQQ